MARAELYPISHKGNFQPNIRNECSRSTEPVAPSLASDRWLRIAAGSRVGFARIQVRFCALKQIPAATFDLKRRFKHSGTAASRPSACSGVEAVT